MPVADRIGINKHTWACMQLLPSLHIRVYTFVRLLSLVFTRINVRGAHIDAIHPWHVIVVCVHQVKPQFKSRNSKAAIQELQFRGHSTPTCTKIQLYTVPKHWNVWKEIRNKTFRSLGIYDLCICTPKNVHTKQKWACKMKCACKIIITVMNRTQTRFLFVWIDECFLVL